MHDLIDETALAGPEHLDPAHVAGYDRKARVDPADDLDALRSHGLAADSTLIDFGAGTGTLALAVAPLCKRVIAVDVSAAMVEAIRAKAATEGVENLECVQAGFLSYSHRGQPADFIYSRNALHHLPDLWKGFALRRMAALLSPGGILLMRDIVFSFDLDEAEAGIANWLQAVAVARPDEGWTREELEKHLRDEYSTFTWLLEPLITQAGFEISAKDYGTVGAYAFYLCVKRSRDA
jgi:2-polyprenyl-3-methyl-5-hydroxy-6-metoxy-1,4-benzoquinol methylase